MSQVNPELTHFYKNLQFFKTKHWVFTSPQALWTYWIAVEPHARLQNNGFGISYTIWVMACVTSSYVAVIFIESPLQWRNNGRDSVSNHQPHDCLFNRLFNRRSKKSSKPRVTGLWAGNLLGTGEFPAQRASNAENISIWWRHHVTCLFCIHLTHV